MNSINSMIAILQIYINLQKNVEVNIFCRNLAEVRKLKYAFAIADDWLKAHNMQIIERDL